MTLKHLICAAMVMASASMALAQNQTIVYEWLNHPCSTNINCNEGCSACALPENSTSLFFGTNSIWVGVPICPLPVSVGNNALYSNAWPTFPSPNHYGLLSALAQIPMQVDSIIIRHRREVAGPQRLKVGYTKSASEPLIEVADVQVGVEFEHTVITNLGCLDMPPGASFGTMQLRVQAYQGNGGNWHLDAIRIVGSPCSAISTGIGHPGERTREEGTHTYFDVLGRPIKGEPAPGVYIGPRRVVQLF